MVFLLAQPEATGVRGELFPMEGAALGEVAVQEWGVWVSLAPLEEAVWGPCKAAFCRSARRNLQL